MPRRREVPKRVILPDPKFGSEILARFINVVMLSGKKAVAEQIVYRALEEVAKRKSMKISTEAEVAALLRIFETALENVKPMVEVKARRVGGATYQIPIEVRPVRARAVGMRWIVQAARARSEKGMRLRLAGELMDAFEGRGAAVKKREATHSTAEANRAFAHFRAG
jgi:small subunit ribosomal protein S7